MRTRIVTLAVVAILLMFAVIAPGIRRRFIQDIITWDAPPSEPATLPGTRSGAGLAAAERVRVILIDGLGTAAAHKLPTWSSLCRSGLRLTVDVGFPTVSLPVEVTLWSGLTQQQTGVMFRSDRPLSPPLDRRGLPARVAGSIAIAEHHGYIVRSLGFAVAEPAAGSTPARDFEPDAWAKQWEQRALEAVSSDAKLVFVHVLRVDTWGHRKGGDSAEYAKSAAESDAILAKLHAGAPGARWFLLSDHGHLESGGHGGDEREVRQVEGCIVGPGIGAAEGGPVHLVDVSRALADSLQIPLDARTLARPMSVALKAPLQGDDALPPLALGRGVLAIVLLVAGVAATVWAVRKRWWLAPWWFLLASGLLLVVRGVPTMSMPMVYAKEDLFDFFDFDKRLMMRTWFITLPIAFAATLVGLRRGTPLVRALVGQLAVPAAALAAALTACGGWAPLAGSEVSPMVPYYTAFVSPLLLMVAQGSGAVALAVHVHTVLGAFGRRPPAETPRSAT